MSKQSSTKTRHVAQAQISSDLLLAELGGIIPKSLSLEEHQWRQMGSYLDLILQWNHRVHLISSTDEVRLVSRHMRESLALLSAGQITPDSEIMDLGTGAGFPGLPLKIAVPSLRLTLLDSRRSKTLFLEQAVRTLALTDTRVVCARAEKLSGDFLGRYDVVLARAVASLEELWRWAGPLLRSTGVLLAQKGGDLAGEIAAVQSAFPKIVLTQLQYDLVWQVDPSRCVIAIRKEKP